MRRISFVFLALVIASTGCTTVKSVLGKPFMVSQWGKTQAQIVVAEDASPSTRYAAEELQRFLKEMSGAELPIVTDSAPVKKHEIILGKNAHLYPANVSIDFDALGKEGYILRTTNRHLIIAGGEPRGTLYGVYGLLEDHLGCRWFTPATNRIPKKVGIFKIRALHEKVTPELEYREPFTKDCFDGDWCARNRMNGNTASLTEKHGGKVTYFGFVHTFNSLVPPEKYFAEHPEYFSMVKGQRIQDHTQLCCTNEEVVRIVIEEIKRWMREHPEATVFSVSQNDWGNYCECGKCAALAKQEDSQIAPVLSLVNRVAEAVKDEFPDKVIDTLAYQWTRKPPKTMRPAPNVIIRLCSIECCFAHSFEKCNHPDNKKFVKDVKGWATMCDRLWVWDYVTSFSHYLVPFPNLRVRDDNIRFLAKHNVTGIFEQDVYTTLNGELSPLSGYLNAKLLWNPHYDKDKAIKEFCRAVYGKAAKPILKYIDLIHDEVENRNIHMDIWIGPEHRHLNDALLAEADTLWNQAETAVANDPETLERVRVARLSVDYAILERIRARSVNAYTMDHEHFKVILDPEFLARAKRFFDVAERNGVTMYRESDGALENLKKEYGNMQPEQVYEPKAAVSPGATAAGLRCRYFEGAWPALPDFSALKPADEKVVDRIGLDGIPTPAEAFGLEFTGYLEAPKDGVYSFSLEANDGANLYIDGVEIVNNDGQHKTVTRSGMTGLRAGKHALRVVYFQAGSNKALNVQYAGPGIEAQTLPANALSHTP